MRLHVVLQCIISLSDCHWLHFTVNRSTQCSGPHLSRSISVGSADQRTPPNSQPVTKQLCHSSRPKQPGQVLWLPQVENAASLGPGGAALQDDRARGPGPRVKVGYQPI